MAEKILLVDDEKDILSMLGKRLRHEGFEVVVAVNGQEGLSQVTNESPDLIVLDVMMPKMDGCEMSLELRERPEGKDIPILFLSARNQDDDLIAGYMSGADSYLTKPFEMSAVVQEIRRLLDGKEKSSGDTETAPD